MSTVRDQSTLKQVQTVARRARLANTANEPLKLTPQLAGVLADYLNETLETADDQAWFWAATWQTGEREAEEDLAAGRRQTFDTMEELLNDLGLTQ
jgi:hypothetical protein